MAVVVMDETYLCYPFSASLFTLHFGKVMIVGSHIGHYGLLIRTLYINICKAKSDEINNVSQILN